MESLTKPRLIYAVGVLVAASALVACGDDDFENRPRPPVALQLTGVIGERKVTVSPATVGAGPIVLTVSNQTGESHTLTLRGLRLSERTGPINPNDTAQIQKTLPRGEYEVRAGSPRAEDSDIEPALLRVRGKRPSASDELLLP